MNKKMEAMIGKELGIGINKIRKESWEKLDRYPGKRRGIAFRPKNMFIVGGNINLAEKRKMGKIGLEFRNTYRKAMYKVKWLLRGRKNA